MPVHQNYIESSNFMFISAGLGILNFSIMPGAFSSLAIIFIGVLSILFVAGISFLIRKGISWIKYFLIALFTLGLYSTITFIIKGFELNPTGAVLTILQSILQFWALILLFKIPDENAN